MSILLLTDADLFPFDDEDRATIAAEGAELRELDGHDREAMVAAAAGADVVFVYNGRFPREAIERLDSVRLLARCGVGVDNVDIAAAREHGIEVTYVPDYGVEDVAEHALALLLACARKVALCDRAVRAGAWPTTAELAPVHRLRGRTLGIYGFGRIGRSLAEKGQALGLRILAYDPYVPEAGCERDVLLRESDFLSIHVPLSDETRHAIGSDELMQMKRGAILVNTSRGPIVDTVALARALEDGHLGGAGLDVFEEEPLPHDHALRRCETAVLTPHAAACTEEALAALRKRALADALGVLRGEPPADPVPL